MPASVSIPALASAKHSTTPGSSHDPIDLLRDMIAIPSLSTEEAEVADYVESWGQAADLDVWRYDDNVVLSVGEANAGGDVLLLNSHLDVVPPSSAHPFDPFDPVVQDGWLYGRGSVDAKASGAAMLTALADIAHGGGVPAGSQCMVALTACEEGGGQYNGLQDLWPHLPEITAAVIGEPTSLVPCVAQKGLLILKIHAHGTAAHAGRPHLGVNAIPRAMAAIEKLQELSLDRPDPHLGVPTLTVTTIEGGTARNAVPEHCVFAVDIRTTPAYTHADIIDAVEQALAGLDGIEIEVYSNRFVPCATPPDARIGAAAEAACAASGGSVEPFGSPTASDWIFLADVPAVKLGPGDSERSHTADERIRLEDVRRAADVYTRLARTYLSNSGL